MRARLAARASTLGSPLAKQARLHARVGTPPLTRTHIHMPRLTRTSYVPGGMERAGSGAYGGGAIAGPGGYGGGDGYRGALRPGMGPAAGSGWAQCWQPFVGRRAQATRGRPASTGQELVWCAHSARGKTCSAARARAGWPAAPGPSTLP